TGVSPERIIDCSNPQVAQALAAAGRGVAIVSDDSRFDLVPVRLAGRDGVLRIELFAAWEPDHHAAATLAELAGRLRAFCIERYGDDVTPA
ncbi:MAG: LysR family transcriptional regulator, partial [Aeromicrobium sp.]